MATAQLQYATLEDMLERVTQHDLKDLSTESGETIDEDRINAALLDASTEIDASLISRYQLPLDNVPEILVRMCCEIALYRMQGLRPLANLEDVRKRYDDARKDLEMIRNGKLSLGVDPIAAKQPTLEQPSTVLTSNSPMTSQIFSRDRLKNY